MTGTIQADGSVGQVAGILEKATAAKELGANIFIVPEGQSTQVLLKPNETCVRKFGFIFCETTYEKEVLNIGETVGISIIEVSTVEDAMKYLII